MLSDLSSGVTGEIHHVDAGYNVIGMKAEDAPGYRAEHSERRGFTALAAPGELD